MRPVFRVDPRLPVTAVKTYGVAMPRATHWRPASCAEVDCGPHLHGWACTVQAGSADEATLRRAAAGGVDGRRRHFTAERQPDGFLRCVFPAGQPCLRASTHRVPLDRPEIFTVRGGDWRGVIGEVRRHARAQDWIEDFALHQQCLADRLERG